jgi:hypothetical protein
MDAFLPSIACSVSASAIKSSAVARISSSRSSMSPSGSDPPGPASVSVHIPYRGPFAAQLARPDDHFGIPRTQPLRQVLWLVDGVEQFCNVAPEGGVAAWVDDQDRLHGLPPARRTLSGMLGAARRLFRGMPCSGVTPQLVAAAAARSSPGRFGDRAGAAVTGRRGPVSTDPVAIGVVAIPHRLSGSRRPPDRASFGDPRRERSTKYKTSFHLRFGPRRGRLRAARVAVALVECGRMAPDHDGDTTARSASVTELLAAWRAAERRWERVAPADEVSRSAL